MMKRLMAFLLAVQVGLSSFHLPVMGVPHNTTVGRTGDFWSMQAMVLPGVSALNYLADRPGNKKAEVLSWAATFLLSAGSGFWLWQSGAGTMATLTVVAFPFTALRIWLQNHDPTRPLRAVAEKNQLIKDLESRLKILRFLAAQAVEENGSAGRLPYSTLTKGKRKHVIQMTSEEVRKMDALKVGTILRAEEDGRRYRIVSVIGQTVVIKLIGSSDFDSEFPDQGVFLAGTPPINLQTQIDRTQDAIRSLQDPESPSILRKLFRLSSLDANTDMVPLKKLSSRQSLDEDQWKAVEQALQRRQITLIEGPPGTGKSTIIEQMIREAVAQGKRVIVTSQMNQAVDVIASRLLENPFLQEDIRIPMLRLGHNEDRIAPEVHAIWSRKRSGGNGKSNGTPSTSQGKGPGSQNPAMDRYVADLNGLKEKNRPAGSVIFATNIGLALNEQMNPERGPNKGTLFIMDEASRENVTAALAAFEHVRDDGKIVIVGDGQQLPTFGLTREERAYLKSKGITDPSMDRFEVSILDYLLEQNWGDRLRLLVNFRSRPRIVRLFSELFYGGEVEAHRKDSGDPDELILADLANDANPGQFFERDGPDSESYLNYRSAEEVIKLIRHYINKKNLKPEEITVVTPYEAQVQLLEDRIEQEFGTLGAIAVTTIDSYQGGQNRAVILDFVRSNRSGKLGFTGDPHRLNVALSRAEDYLSIVWDSRTLVDEPYRRQTEQEITARAQFRLIQQYFIKNGRADFIPTKPAVTPDPSKTEASSIEPAQSPSSREPESHFLTRAQIQSLHASVRTPEEWMLGVKILVGEEDPAAVWVRTFEEDPSLRDVMRRKLAQMFEGWSQMEHVNPFDPLKSFLTLAPNDMAAAVVTESIEKYAGKVLKGCGDDWMVMELYRQEFKSGLSTLEQNIGDTGNGLDAKVQSLIDGEQTRVLRKILDSPEGQLEELKTMLHEPAHQRLAGLIRAVVREWIIAQHRHAATQRLEDARHGVASVDHLLSDFPVLTDEERAAAQKKGSAVLAVIQQAEERHQAESILASEDFDAIAPLCRELMARHGGTVPDWLFMRLRSMILEKLHRPAEKRADVELMVRKVRALWETVQRPHQVLSSDTLMEVLKKYRAWRRVARGIQRDAEKKQIPRWKRDAIVDYARLNGLSPEGSAYAPDDEAVEKLIDSLSTPQAFGPLFRKVFPSHAELPLHKFSKIRSEMRQCMNPPSLEEDFRVAAHFAELEIQEAVDSVPGPDPSTSQGRHESLARHLAERLKDIPEKANIILFLPQADDLQNVPLDVFASGKQVHIVTLDAKRAWRVLEEHLGHADPDIADRIRTKRRMKNIVFKEAHLELLFPDAIVHELKQVLNTADSLEEADRGLRRIYQQHSEMSLQEIAESSIEPPVIYHQLKDPYDLVISLGSLPEAFRIYQVAMERAILRRLVEKGALPPETPLPRTLQDSIWLPTQLYNTASLKSTNQALSLYAREMFNFLGKHAMGHLSFLWTLFESASRLLVSVDMGVCEWPETMSYDGPLEQWNNSKTLKSGHPRTFWSQHFYTALPSIGQNPLNENFLDWYQLIAPHQGVWTRVFSFRGSESSSKANLPLSWTKLDPALFAHRHQTPEAQITHAGELYEASTREFLRAHANAEADLSNAGQQLSPFVWREEVGSAILSQIPEGKRIAAFLVDPLEIHNLPRELLFQDRFPGLDIYTPAPMNVRSALLSISLHLAKNTFRSPFEPSTSSPDQLLNRRIEEGRVRIHRWDPIAARPDFLVTLKDILNRTSQKSEVIQALTALWHSSTIGDLTLPMTPPSNGAYGAVISLNVFPLAFTAFQFGLERRWAAYHEDSPELPLRAEESRWIRTLDLGSERLGLSDYGSAIMPIFHEMLKKYLRMLLAMAGPDSLLWLTTAIGRGSWRAEMVDPVTQASPGYTLDLHGAEGFWSLSSNAYFVMKVFLESLTPGNVRIHTMLLQDRETSEGYGQVVDSIRLHNPPPKLIQQILEVLDGATLPSMRPLSAA